MRGWDKILWCICDHNRLLVRDLSTIDTSEVEFKLLLVANNGISAV